MIQVYQCDEILSLWCEFLDFVTVHHFGENSSQWWKPITIIETHQYEQNSIILMKIKQADEILSLWWKFILVMKFVTNFIILMIWGLLSYTKFSSIYNFLTFQGGWVGEIKIKDQIIPAAAGVWAELGNIENQYI